jgi:hypothetical protein
MIGEPNKYTNANQSRFHPDEFASQAMTIPEILAAMPTSNPTTTHGVDTPFTANSKAQ